MDARSPYVDVPLRRRIIALIATLTVVAWALLALFVRLFPNPGPRLTFKKGSMFYREPVTKIEATRVGEYLVWRDYFSDEAANAAQLAQERGIYRLGFVIDPEQVDNPCVAIEFGNVAGEISREVLGGKGIEVALCDDRVRPVKIVPASAKVAFGKSELYYTEPISADLARAVGDQLVLSGDFRDDRPTAVHLSRDQEAYQLRFWTSAAENPRVIEAFKELASAIAISALGGQPVLILLCDRDFTFKRERVEPPAQFN